MTIPTEPAIPPPAMPEAVARRYLAVLLASLAALLAAVLALNLPLGERAMGSPDVVKAASDWQQATRGVTYPPPITVNRPFKTLRLYDRLPEVNAVVFGASSSMGLTADVFPDDIRIYNFAQTGNPLHSTIPEAEDAARRFAGQVRWFFVALDWALGTPYASGEPGTIELSREAALAPAALPQVTFTLRLKEALAWPRVRNLGALLLGVVRADDPLEEFRSTFLVSSGADYYCPDGVPGRDFDTINRGICAGFRYDGSSTFADGRRVDPTRGLQLARAGAAPSSRYSQALAPTDGEPNPVLLARLAALSETATAAGGRLILFMPPLIPGLERALVDSTHAGATVRRTKTAFDAWAERTGVVIVDVGASERFGCIAGEFLDEHHAFPDCFRKVWTRFWSEYAAGTVRPGLWPHFP
ncbi:MAG: hypothetical protein KIT18_08510 [Burkholderiales bacterium]|nr:hypothetical protein [Burkholderiales bacterium]